MREKMPAPDSPTAPLDLSLRSQVVVLAVVGILPLAIITVFMWLDSERQLSATHLGAFLLLHTIVVVAISGYFRNNVNRSLAGLRQMITGQQYDASALGGTGDLGELSRDIILQRFANERRTSQYQAVLAEMSHAAEELAGLAHQGKEGANRQTNSIETIAASIEQMSVSVSSVAEHAKTAEQGADASLNAARQGTDITRKLRNEMHSATQTVQRAAGLVDSLGQRSTEIRNLVDVINAVADQTNLLALNAAIESARAGEHGRGFAVVSDEVRSLAGRTREVTDQISGLAHQTQQEVSDAITAMQAVEQCMDRSVSMSETADGALQQIQQQASHTLQLASDIALALQEQQQASQDIARNTDQINMQSQNLNNAIDETAQTAEHLTSLAAELT
jgi:methyl-accepting chemotaxis protein